MRYQDVWIVVPALTRRASSATSSPIFARFSTTSSASTTAARTARATSRCGQGLTSCSHPVNLGQGAAIQTGVEYARSQPGAQVFATFDADGQHRLKDVIAMIDRLSTEDVDMVVGTRFAEPSASKPPLLKRIILRAAAVLSPSSRQLRLTDAHNGLRVFNKKVADGLNITMSGMSHASEFITLAVENHWRVAEEPVEILYTDYSKSKGQPLLNGVNIVFDGLLRGRLSR